MFALFGSVAGINKGWQPKNCLVVVSSGVFIMVSGQFKKCICLATEPQELEEKVLLEPEELQCVGLCLFSCSALLGGWAGAIHRPSCWTMPFWLTPVQAFLTLRAREHPLLHHAVW